MLKRKKNGRKNVLPSDRLLLTPDDIDKFLKERLERLLEAGERPIMIASYIDIFGDAELCLCSECGQALFMRPWMFKATKEYKLKVVCFGCAAFHVEPDKIFSQIENDIDTMERKRFGSMYG